jgi:invasion protein IalB
MTRTAGSARFHLAWLLPAALWAAGCAPAAAQQQSPSSETVASVEAEPEFFIKPSEVVVPEGVPVGQYRRIIEPHQNWTLICDENLKEKKRICNIAQQVADRSGAVVFSWSLAGTSDGKPIMILRAPASVGKGAAIRLTFPGKAKPIDAVTEACDQWVCVSMIKVGPRMTKYIGAGSQVEVSFPVAGDASGDRVVIRTTLEGLSAALAAI